MQIPPYSQAQEIHRGRRYTVLRVRGSDGVARILKVVRSGGQVAGSVALLRRELEVLRGLGLPGVARPLGLTELDRAPALVLEDAGPHHLREQLHRRPMSLGAFLDGAAQLAAIVAGLHARGILHRDINATNVVVGEDGRRLTLVGFALATSVAGARAEAAPSDFAGTLCAVAPEQTGRMNRPVDHRADLYALGATFYEMLTGRPPFASRDPAELVHAHLARTPVAPIDIDRAVPRLLSDLVLRLLAKMPEHRYQSAEALVADLREATRRFEAGQAIAGFELGRVDLDRQLAVPGRLHGRERELGQLTRAFERAADGAAELVLLEGAAGVGKSALMRELACAASRRGRTLAGKFDQLRGDVPYAPLVELGRELVRALRREPAAALEAWRGRVREALGPTVGLVLEVVPDLAEVLGEPVPAAGAEADRRFPMAFQAFLQTLATAESPLVIFLDDLQWADAASLRLLQALAVPEAHHMLLVGAYRGEEVGPEHPLQRLAAAARQGGIAPLSIALAPLDLEALTALCLDALDGERGERGELTEARALAAVVLQKTAGNPFFVQRFLRHLHRSGLLAFDAERGAWAWDARRIAEASLTENVVELMVTTIRRLPEETQRALRISACLPDRIELDLLAAVAGEPAAETAAHLWSALQEGLLLPETAPAGEGRAAFRFAHDRVKQAAYSLLGAGERARLHVSAGQRLLEGSEREVEERLFEAVDQLARGAELLEGPGRHELAALSLRAARKAKGSSAFGQALAYAARGLELLPKGAWRDEHALWLALSREAAECAFLTSDFAGAEARIDAALPLCASRFEQLDLDALRILSSTVAQDHGEAIRWAREALRRFGLALPAGEVAAATARAELPGVEERLSRRSGAELLAAPPMEDADALACMRLLSGLTAPTWLGVEQGLFSFVVTRMVDLSLRLGMAPQSGGAFVRMGLILGDAHDDFPARAELSGLGVELSLRHGDAREQCRALFGLAIHMGHWQGPVRATLALYRRAEALGLACGDLEYAVFAREHATTNVLCMGAELDQALAHIESALAFARKFDHRTSVRELRMRRQAVRCLQGRTRGLTFDDDEFDTASFLAATRSAAPVVCRYEILTLVLRYLLGDLAGARAMSEAASRHLDAVRGAVTLAEHNVYTSLTLAALAGSAAPAERAALLAALADNQRRLGRWALGCPQNYRHKHDLVAAEVGRVEGRPLDEILPLYEQAIEGARREGFLQDEALASELAGRCLHQRGRRVTAAYHLHAAIRGFSRWGATAKVEALEEEFRGLVAAPAVTATLSAAPSLEDAGGAALDVLSLLKTVEPLSSEVVLDRLLEKLLAVCLEAGGAQRGALALHEDGELWVRALGAVSEPPVIERTRLSLAAQLPRSILEDVHRTGEPVVLADAARRGRFTADPDVIARSVRSALAVPVRKQARVVGVLYLENDLATRAFTKERARVLDLLSAQIAVALENSLLFEKLTVEIGERLRAERALGFLAESSALLAESLDYEATLTQVAALAVPFLADWCIVDVLDRDGHLARVGAAHADPEKAPLLRELRERYPPALDGDVPAAVTVRTGEPYLGAHVDDAHTTSICQDARHAEIVCRLGSRSVMAVPLVARDRSLGAITFHSAAPDRAYGPADLALAQALARRAALSIDNARLYHEAQEALRFSEDFVSVASHELNTPITSLQLAVQALSRGQGAASPEKLARVLQTVERQGWRLAALVGEMLDVSRIRAGRFELSLETVDLAAVVRDAVERLSPQIAQARCPLSVRIEGEGEGEGEAPVPGRWDAVRLAQVVTNLLTNAIKYGQGQPIEVLVEERGSVARLRIADRGIGIEPALLHRVFERFERGVSAKHYGGLGLGLYIVHEIVAALGGSVGVESELGVGSTFTVELPRAGPGEPVSGPALPAGPALPGPGGSRA